MTRVAGRMLFRAITEVEEFCSFFFLANDLREHGKQQVISFFIVSTKNQTEI